MPKPKQDLNLSLSGYNDIFSSTGEAAAINPAVAADTQGERIVEIPLSELHPPEFHPFHVKDDEAMERLAANIKQYGVREPGLARPRAGGGYELLAGNRRKRACELAEIPVMPVIVREMQDADAAIAMVDSNLEQRETLLFSEKAWAYWVKMQAMGHKGVKDEKQSVDILTEQTGESRSQIFRFIRLTELIVELMDKLDAKQLAFNPAVELSYLSKTEQRDVLSAMDGHGVKPSHKQALELKKLKQSGDLTAETIQTVLSVGKNSKKTNGGNGGIEQYRKYFPENFSLDEIDGVIVELLLSWQANRNVMSQTALHSA